MRVLASVQRAAARPIAGTVSGEITGAISSCFEGHCNDSFQVSLLTKFGSAISCARIGR